MVASGLPVTMLGLIRTLSPLDAYSFGPPMSWMLCLTPSKISWSQAFLGTCTMETLAKGFHHDW